MIPLLLTFAMDTDEAAAEVRPGWIPLVIVLLLGAFIAFLYFSMKKQLGKIDIPDDTTATSADDEPGPTA
jgi:hypothetical protein